MENRTPVVEKERAAPKVVNLMDALRASLREPAAANDAGGKAKAKARPAKSPVRAKVKSATRKAG
jgi:DNA end-binding protein Ku